MSWTEGFLVQDFSLDPRLRSLAIAQDWKNLDQVMATLVAPGGDLWNVLTPLATFTRIEHMLALRDAADPEQEDGIWHDDGSRVLAFSLSLNYFGLPQGGELAIRPKGGEARLLGPFEPGKLIIFRTGTAGFEHRTLRVTAGLRLVCAGWCS
jgi:hypothetical protein